MRPSTCAGRSTPWRWVRSPRRTWACSSTRSAPKPKDFKAELRNALNDPAIKIDQLLGFTPAVSSTDTPLYRAIASVTREHYPKAAIVPAVLTGFTDSHFFRDRGIAAYGYSPFLVPESDESGVHGNNERISVENMRTGTQMMIEIVKAMVTSGKGN